MPIDVAIGLGEFTAIEVDRVVESMAAEMKQVEMSYAKWKRDVLTDMMKLK